VLDNTVSFNYFQWRHKRLFQNGKCNYIFLSNYLEEKGILLLISVFEKLPSGYKLHCYGNFANKNIEDFLKTSSFKNVVINGPIFNDKKLEAISNADCLILPSFNEGKPLVILEAISVGTPVITFDVGFMSELLPSNYPFLLKNISASVLESAIRNFENYTMEEKVYLSNNLIKYFDANFSVEKHRDDLLNIFTI